MCQCNVWCHVENIIAQRLGIFTQDSPSDMEFQAVGHPSHSISQPANANAPSKAHLGVLAGSVSNSEMLCIQ